MMPLTWKPPRGTEKIAMPAEHDEHLAAAMRVIIDRKISQHNNGEPLQVNKVAPVDKVHRVYPPAEGTGEREVLYIDKNGQHSTAYVLGDVCIVLSEGW